MSVTEVARKLSIAAAPKKRIVVPSRLAQAPHSAELLKSSSAKRRSRMMYVEAAMEASKGRPKLMRSSRGQLHLFKQKLFTQFRWVRWVGDKASSLNL